MMSLRKQQQRKDKMNLGERLFELRKTEGLSQEEVAERLSVTRQTVSKWETGQSTPDFDKVLPLCELYHISTEELFTGEKSDHSEISVSEALNDNEESPEEIALKKQQFREKSARVVSIAVFIYIASVVVLMIGIPVLQIMTSNAPEGMYRGLVENYQQVLSRFVGPTEIFVSGDTLQLKDYGKTDWPWYFDAEAKYRRHETEFPKECQRAYELGAAIAEKTI